MATTNPYATSSPTLDAYQDRITALAREAKAKLEEFAIKATGKAAQAEIAAITSLNLAKANIDRKLQDLKSTHQEYQARAKAEIDADVAKFKASVDQLVGPRNP